MNSALNAPSSTVHAHSRRYDAVVCDIDGCLGPETNAPMNAACLAAIAQHNIRARRAGDVPTVTLCSGRPQPFAEAICRVIANETLPIICEMGVWLFDPAKGLYLRDPAITASHLAMVADATRWIEETLGPKGVVMQPGKVASISLWHPDTPYLMALKPVLAETFAAKSWLFRISSSVCWVNCDLTIVSKATGIRRFIEATGIPSSRLAGIGDTMGDLAIAESVAFFACPANAEPALKAKAAYVSPHEEIEGVLEILGKLS